MSTKRRPPLSLEVLEDRVLLSAANAQLIPATGLVDDRLDTAATEDYFTFTVDEDGEFRARLSAAVAPRLTLFSLDERELVRSDGVVGSAVAAIDQYLEAGSYLLRVSAPSALSVGDYQLQTAFQSALQPAQPLPAGGNSFDVVSADVNRDGLLDLVVANGISSFFFDPTGLSVFLGNGDGSFQPERRFFTGTAFRTVDLADFDRDGKLDLVATVGVFVHGLALALGDGAGGFGELHTVPAAGDGSFPDVADYNDDGWLDLAFVPRFENSVTVLQGGPALSFESTFTAEVGLTPTRVRSADLNRDGRLDLVVASSDSGIVSVFLGTRAGFGRRHDFAAGVRPNDVTIGDVDRDGRLDLVVANGGSEFRDNGVTTLRGDGAGSFSSPRLRRGLGAPTTVDLLDVNNDGWLDVAVTTAFRGEVFVALNRCGTFETPRPLTAGENPNELTGADLNGDGNLDLAIVGVLRSGVSVLLGNGDGAFQTDRRLVVGRGPQDIALADVNRDGTLDLVAVNDGSDDLAVLLGNGDASFRRAISTPVGINPVEVELADLNNDNRLDAVVVNRGVIDLNPDNDARGDLSILLGTGDGTFQTEQRFKLDDFPRSMQLGDVNADGNLDIIATTIVRDFVLLGNGDGTFAAGIPLPTSPTQFALGDVNGDGLLDLVSASGNLIVLFGLGRRGFAAPVFSPLLLAATDFKLADVNADDRLDLVTIVGGLSGEVMVLLGNGDGTFAPQGRFAAGLVPQRLSVGDLNNDGYLDLAVSSTGTGQAVILLGAGAGTFEPQQLIRVGVQPLGIEIGDLNGDGNLDVVTGNFSSNDASPLIGDGTGAFELDSLDRTSGLRHTPQRGDLDGDGVADTVTLNDGGDVLFRRGLPGTSNLFGPPLVVNRGRPARDLALLDTPTGRGVVVSDIRGDTLSVYRLLDGTPTRTAIPAGRLPQWLQVADLDGDGQQDIVVTNSQNDAVTIVRQNPDGTFAIQATRAAGVSPTDIALADLDGEPGLDILVSNRSSGDVAVFYNDSGHLFLRTARYRAGLGLPASQQSLGLFQPLLPEEPFSLVAGLFDGDSHLDVVVVDRGTHRLRTLLGTPDGGFFNPAEALSISTSQRLTINDRPGELVSADFNRDGRLDVAVVMEERGEVWLYLGNGDGTFTLGEMVPVGNSPTGLSLDQLNDDNDDGRIDADDAVDLLIGNGFGDILFVLGDGDGGFRPFVRTDQRVPFVATDLDGDGRIDVVLADQARDVVRSRLRTGASFMPGAFRRDGRNGLIGPGDVALADLDGRFGSDLIFANTGSNNVLVYLRTADGSFARRPRSFFAGTNPVDLRVAQFTDDNGDNEIDSRDVPDLAVANEGSNDVSILLGSRSATGSWTFNLGPRLQVDGFGPRFLATRDVNRDGVLDIIATSGQGGQATLLPGLGGGFFNDVAPERLNLGADVLEADGTFALLTNGNVVQFDFLGATVSTVFTSTRGGTALQVMALPGLQFPLLFVGNGDGTVSGLMSSDGLTYTETALRGDFDLDNPSALQVLQGGNNQLEVYVSDAGENGLVVLRFGVEELTAGLVALDGGASLALVAALTSTTVPNSLLIDVLLDEIPAVVEVGELFAAEEFTGTLSVVGERIESVGEQVLSALTAAEGVPVGLVGDAVDPPQGLRELILGVEEGLKRFVQPSEPPTPAAPDPKEKQEMPESPSVPQTSESVDGAGESAGPTSGVDREPEDALTPLLTAAFFVAGLQTMRPWRGRSTRLHGGLARR